MLAARVALRPVVASPGAGARAGKPALPARAVVCKAQKADDVVRGSLNGLVAAATLFAAGNANAATEIAQLAAGDNRFGIIVSLFVPVLGWVAFNALGPGLNQLDAMREKSKNRAAIVAGAAGLAGLLHAQGVNAAEIAQIAEGDNRFGIIVSLFVPVLGWVAFNALGPGLNQLDAMREKSKNRAAIVAGAAGLAGLLHAQGVNAAEIAQIAEGDNRFGIIVSLFVPVLGWVAFNALGPGLNQLDAMREKSKSRK